MRKGTMKGTAVYKSQFSLARGRPAAQLSVQSTIEVTEARPIRARPVPVALAVLFFTAV